MFDLKLFIRGLLDAFSPLREEGQAKKKADVVEHPQVFGHVGLLFNGPPGTAGLPFI
jgi:hypothetical protein